jgi:uncharacterized protein
MEYPGPRRITRLALWFEGALGLAALAIGWLIGHWPALGMNLAWSAAGEQARAIGWGIVATVPPLLALVVIDRFPIGPLRQLRELAHAQIRPMFAGASLLQLAAISLAAGWGEEMLFRGLVQGGLSRWLPADLGSWAALVIASIVFGVCHWLNTTYAVLAMLAGAYFGLLLIFTGSLWPPIVAHALYDFVALVYLVRPNHWVRPTIELPPA